MNLSARIKHVLGAVAGCLCFCATLYLAGCGGSKGPSSSAQTAEDSVAVHSGASAAARAGQDDAARPNDPGNAAEPPLPKEGSPEWLLGQMIVLRAEPLPEAKTPQEREAALRARHEKLVEMAHEAIGKTHNDKSKESIFNGAVHFLVESRLQLAIGGGKEEAKALYDDAEDLYRRDSASEAAAEAGFAVARLAHTNARRFAKTDPRFLQEFAVQARLFATRFPLSESRAVQLLSNAGQSCELHHMDADAVGCYAMLQEKYPQTRQAQQAASVLRRLELKGKRLELGGETPDGGFVKIEQFKGKPVLIVFWSSDSERFLEMLPQLNLVSRKYERSDLAVIGVCLDESETSMDDFVEKNGLSWTQLFYADQAKRRWDHPVVQRYGVHDIPSLWLVNAEGIVVDTHVRPDSLDGQLKSLVASRFDRPAR